MIKKTQMKKSETQKESNTCLASKRIGNGSVCQLVLIMICQK